MFRSLKSKLLSVIAAAFILLLVVLATQINIELRSMEKQLVEQTQTTMEAEVLGRLEAEAAGLSRNVSGFLNGLFRVTDGLAVALANSSASINGRLNRNQVNELVKNSLVAHEDLSALYAQFEADGYDGNDVFYQGADAIHSVPDTGALEIYWIREEDGSVAQEQVADSSEKYLDAKDEFGQREAEWYLCSRDSLKPCVLQPYLYEIREGYEALMTSLTVPVVVDDNFRGVVGIDVNLPIIQSLIDDLQQKLYGGKSRITLLSDLGLIVGSSVYKEKLTRPLHEATDSLNGQLLSLHSQPQRTLLNDGTYYVAYPMEIDAAGTTWSLLVELPEEVVLASATQLTDTMDESINGMLIRLLVVALLATAVVLVAVMLLVRSIVQPIRQLDERVQNLASQDGDLSKTIDIQTHSELMSLSDGFNSFIAKLRVMVNELKQIGSSARNSAEQIKAVNAKAAMATEDQQNEIESVVAATTEMSQTATNVSELAAEVSANAQSSLQTVVQSQEDLSRTVQDVDELSSEMTEAGTLISEVASRTEDINQILDVIRAIADQTNLLALNAAIEAARAGDQGRGFAVVADEVRTLAAKTQNSTDEINELIGNLNTGVDKAVTAIANGSAKADQTNLNVKQSYQALSNVVTDVNSIAEHITQVATAAEEQSAVSEEITKNLTIIGDAARALAQLANESDAAGVELEQEMNQLDAQLASLKT